MQKRINFKELTMMNKEGKKFLFLPLLATLIVVGIVVWQGCKHFQQPNQPATKTSAISIRVATAPPADAPNAKINTPVEFKNDLSAVGNTVLNPEIMARTEYMRLFNEYQVAQLQRMIAENNEAIAMAKRNAAQAVSDMAKLLTGVPQSSKMTNNGIATLGYELIFTSQQNDGRWTATLKKHGQSYNIIAGQRLADGSKVVSIDENSVLLTKDSGLSKELITFSGEMKMSTNQPFVAVER